MAQCTWLDCGYIQGWDLYGPDIQLGEDRNTKETSVAIQTTWETDTLSFKSTTTVIKVDNVLQHG